MKKLYMTPVKQSSIGFELRVVPDFQDTKIKALTRGAMDLMAKFEWHSEYPLSF